MPLLDQRTTAVIRTLVIYAVIGALLYATRRTIELLIFAIFLAYLIEPIVSRIQRWPKISRGSRALAIAEVYIVVAMIAAGLIMGFGPEIASQGRNLLSGAPELLNEASWGKLIQKISSSHGWSYHTQIELEHLVLQHRAEILSGIQQVAVKVEGALTNIFWVVLVPILAIFILHSGRQFAEAGIRMFRLRPRRRLFLKRVLQDINEMAAHYIRAQVLLAAISIPVYTIVLVASGMQYGLILGLLAGALEFIPLVGPLVAAISILGVAFLTGYSYLWVLVLFLGGWRILQDYVNSPHIMQRTVKLHPFAVIIAVLAGAEIAGIIGVFLSIPVAATLQIFWRRWSNSSFALENAEEQPRTTRFAA